MAEKLTGSGGIIQWTNYLFAGGQMVGMRVERSDMTVHTRYFHKDHFGSIATITASSLSGCPTIPGASASTRMARTTGGQYRQPDQPRLHWS
jgi:hypothetical protein